ncbi:tyrosine-type recombinase/integrase [Hyphobacterium sp.]|uniref:tyrosine-type recombinase/integrase n=1 Tax=Hyphobacterium sp. TaxID=2004662 RepID=UPI003B530377
MRKHHPENERVKRQYLIYLAEAKRMAESSIDQVAAALALFEDSTGYKAFSSFHIEQARRFKRGLHQAANAKTGKPLAKATITSRLMALKAFFQWLAGQPGYRSKITYADCDYFNPSAHDARIASAKRERPAPELSQIRHVLESMADITPIEKRNRALIAFAILTGARDDAIASLSLRDVDVKGRKVIQDARTVRTKNRKTFTSWFFPVGEDIEQIVVEWIEYLKTDQLFSLDAPLFPATEVGQDANKRFAPIGLDSKGWANADPIRRIFKEAFEAAGLPYFNPHSFRKTLARYGEQICSSPEDFKAWSQNLGHEQVLTTFTSYGSVSGHRQAEILNRLSCGSSSGAPGTPDRATIDRVLDHLRNGS